MQKDAPFPQHINILRTLVEREKITSEIGKIGVINSSVSDGFIPKYPRWNIVCWLFAQLLPVGYVLMAAHERLINTALGRDTFTFSTRLILRYARTV